MIPRIGILGGTFDPVHNAHLAIARLAIDRLALQKLLWIPTGTPAYRKPPVASGTHRVAMLELALRDEMSASPRHAIDGRELQPSASGFTYDSLCALKAENPEGRFVLIMGSDQYEKRSGWHRWPELEKLCEVAVVARPGSRVDAQVTTIPMAPSAISASDIRARVARGEDVSALVPPAVAAYIREKGLYR
ncbi:MAG: nicotinate (nicotinamide) nucleotide adenylyltransferase [Burkholderiales bacterium]